MIINHAIIALLISSSIRSVPMTAVAEEVTPPTYSAFASNTSCTSASCLSRAICREEREATDASIATLKLQELIPDPLSVEVVYDWKSGSSARDDVLHDPESKVIDRFERWAVRIRKAGPYDHHSREVPWPQPL